MASKPEGLQRFEDSVRRIVAAAKRLLRMQAVEANEREVPPEQRLSALFPTVCKRCGLEALTQVGRMFGLCRACMGTTRAREVRRAPSYSFTRRTRKPRSVVT